MNEKNDIDPIQAYCEKICNNFQALFNRWARQPSLQKFNYSATEMNKKFKVLAKREYNDRLAAPKDYNMMVDSIMSLTGSYNSKSKAEYAVPQSTQAQIQRQNQRNATPQKSQIFHDLAPGAETKPLLPENLLSGFNKGLSRQLTLESNDDFGFRPTGNQNASIYSRQGSLSQLLTTFSALKRQDSYDLNDKGLRKKIKWDTADGNGTEDLNKENFTMRTRRRHSIPE